MKLQINTSGAWKDVLTFAPARRRDVIKAAKALAEAAGSDIAWCLVDDNGKREWLDQPLAAVFKDRR